MQHVTNECITINIVNAKIIAYRNFSGRQNKFNPDGYPGFALILPDEFVSELKNAGWNVRELRRDENEGPEYFLPVYISFTDPGYIAEIYTVTKKSKTLLDEETVSLLDKADIENFDISIKPRIMRAKGTREPVCIRAYVKSMYVTINN